MRQRFFPKGMRVLAKSRWVTPPITARLAILALLVTLWAALFACGPSRPRAVYPPPDSLRMAESQRHEFIQLFLRGRWCEAQGMFERSLENYLLQDDFCAAAQNHLIAWKLQQYLNMDADQHLEAAQQLRGTGLPCPQLHLPGETTVGSGFSPADEAYRELIAQGAFSMLASLLRAEPDPLYASVYGRKAALAALHSGKPEQARDLMRQTRELNARQGWIVFLAEDWKIIYALETSPETRHEILQRIARLQALVQPCLP